MSGTPNDAMPVFSYAQAAKGLNPSKPTETSVKNDSADQSAKSSQKSETSSNAPSRASRSRPRTEEKDTQIQPSENGTNTPNSEIVPDKENVPPTRRTPQRSEIPKEPASSMASPEPLSDLGSPQDKELMKKGDRTDSWEKASQVSTSQDRGAATEKDKDQDKAKDSEDDWEKVSVPSIATDKELKAAPVPSVNIWNIRREAQDAKRKELAAQRPAATIAAPATAARPKPAAEESKRKPASRDAADKEGPIQSRKPEITAKPAEAPSTQSSRPVSQQGEKMPPTVDTFSWPTPETADDRRKSSGQDRSEKPDTRMNGAKGQGKQGWITMPFVPTAKFETPLPGNVAKRGARTGRGRDGQSRGGHAASTSERPEPGSMAPPPVPNKTYDQDRGRKSESQRGGRATSVPTNNRRPTSRESTLASLRKPTAPFEQDEAQSQIQAPSNILETQNPNGTAPVGSSDGQSRASSRHEAAAITQDIFTSPPGEVNGTVSYQKFGSDSASRPVYTQERSKAPQSAYRAPADPSRERSRHSNREWSRDKADTAREKVESWRDRDFSGESTGRRQPRPERGHPGSYRGRDKQPYGTHQSHPYTAPLPQNGFDNIQYGNAPEPRSRQSSYAPPNANANRNNPRSHSIPLGMMYQNMYGVPGMQQPMSPLQTDMSNYGYPNQIQMDQGIMSAMPYNTSLNSFAIMSMVVGQIEYYFSVDNLCKDMFLRKNMDSQGYVPLRVVANFKRIKALTEENFPWDMMRSVCTQVRNVEHLPMPDGEDKLRSKEHWSQFVLPVGERFPAAQVEGPPPSATHHQQTHFPAQGHFEGPGVLSPTLRSPNAGNPIVNGTYETASPQTYTPIPPLDGSAGERNFSAPSPIHIQDQSRRDSTQSPKVHHSSIFRDKPSRQMYSPVPLPNGHRRQPSRNFNEEVIFPDESLTEVQICVRDGSDSGIQEVYSPDATRVNSDEGRTSGSEVISQRLRGGAGSSDQSPPRLKGMVFGNANAQSGTNPEATPFVNKEGLQSRMPAPTPGQYFMTYPEVHAASFRDREQGAPDALKTLYNFWSMFLIDKFNLSMYQDFKTVALQDREEGDNFGVNLLLNYYDTVLKRPLPVNDAVASDLVSLLREEADSQGRVHKMLRLAWRNGALNLKTRKKIAELLRPEEKASFDKGG